MIYNIDDAKKCVADAAVADFIFLIFEGKESMDARTRKQLERLAIESHNRDETWNDFWSDHGDAICEVEPFDRQRYHRLLMKLTALVAGGDLDGCMPIELNDQAPWETDDAEYCGSF